MSIPKEAIEAAARADWDNYVTSRTEDPGVYPAFDDLPGYVKDKYRDDVRPMIIAAAPFLAVSA